MRARSIRSPPGCSLVLLGRATRLQRYLLELPKTYRGDRTARLALLDWRP